MKRVLFGILMMSSLVLPACGDSEEHPKGEEIIEDDRVLAWPDMNHFVQEYVDVERLSIQSNEDYVRVACLGGTIGCYRVDSKFDCSYDGPIIPVETNFSILNEFQKIRFVSDSDFDEQHKAQMSLADIVMFAGASPYDFIAGGYRNAYKWDDTDIEFYKKGVCTYRYGYAPIYKRLSEMEATDYLLIHPDFCLVFLKQPTLSKTHRLTLTITDGKWTNWEVSWQQTFGE